MGLLSTETMREKAKEFRTVTGPTNLAPYKVGKRVFKDGYLIYGEGDYVDRETALELGIITEEEAEEEVKKEAEEQALTEPTVSANRPEWDAYAKTLGLDPEDYDNKQQLINAVYEYQTSPVAEVTDHTIYDNTDKESANDESSDTVN